jgi:hypothetical protein
MRAKIANSPIDSFWSLSPKIMGLYIPLGLSYLILDIAEDYSYALIGVPDRQYFWVLTKLKPTIKEGGKALPSGKLEIEMNDLGNSKVFTPAVKDEHIESNSPRVCVTPGKEIPSTSESPKVYVTAEKGVPIASAKEIFECDKAMEAAIMRKALIKAEQLGYDITKVMNVGWSN